MTFLRLKTIKGRCYLYLCKNTWNKKLQQARQKVIKYYGAIDKGKFNKKAVLDRDGHQCCVCRSKKFLTVDHKTPLNADGSNSYENLWTLCKSCNSKKQSFGVFGKDFTDEKKLAKLKFWTQAYENEYRKRMKEKSLRVKKSLMRRSVMQRKKIRQLVEEIKDGN